MAYDRLYRQEMLAKTLTGLSPTPGCIVKPSRGGPRGTPNAPTVFQRTTWGQGAPTTLTHRSWDGSRAHHPQQGGPAPAAQTPASPQAKPREICRNFNGNRYCFTRCRFLHVCSECSGPHSAVHCPQSQVRPANREANPRSRPLAPARSSRLHP